MFRFDPNLFHKSCLDQSGPIFDVIIKQPFLPACFGHAAFGQLSQPVSILRPIQSNLVIIAIDRTGNRNSPVRLAYCYFFFAGDDYKAAIFWVIALRVRSRNFQVNDSPLNKIWTRTRPCVGVVIIAANESPRCNEQFLRPSPQFCWDRIVPRFHPRHTP